MVAQRCLLLFSIRVAGSGKGMSRFPGQKRAVAVPDRPALSSRSRFALRIDKAFICMMPSAPQPFLTNSVFKAVNRSCASLRGTQI